MADIEIHSEEDFEADEEGDSKYCNYWYAIQAVSFIGKFVHARSNQILIIRQSGNEVIVALLKP